MANLNSCLGFLGAPFKRAVQNFGQKMVSTWAQKINIALGRQAPGAFGRYIPFKDTLAIFNPSRNVARLPEFNDIRYGLSQTHPHDVLIVGHKDQIPETVFQAFHSMRGKDWVPDASYQQRDGGATVHVLVARLHTTLKGTFVEPMGMGRVAPVSGQPIRLGMRYKLPEGMTWEAMPDYAKPARLLTQRLHIEPDNSPQTLASMQATAADFEKGLAQLGINDTRAFLDTFAPLSEVGGVFVNKHMRAQQYGAVISRTTKQVQARLGYNYISQTDPHNWHNALKTGTETFGFGAIHPSITRVYPDTKNIPVLTFVMGNQATEQALVQRGWIAMRDFAPNAKDMSKLFDAAEIKTPEGIPTGNPYKNLHDLIAAAS